MHGVIEVDMQAQAASEARIGSKDTPLKRRYSCEEHDAGNTMNSMEISLILDLKVSEIDGARFQRTSRERCFQNHV